jgi:hypothetical protein
LAAVDNFDRSDVSWATLRSLFAAWRLETIGGLAAHDIAYLL